MKTRSSALAFVGHSPRRRFPHAAASRTASACGANLKRDDTSGKRNAKSLDRRPGFRPEREGAHAEICFREYLSGGGRRHAAGPACAAGTDFRVFRADKRSREGVQRFAVCARECG